MAYLPVIIMGAGSILLQILCLRQLLSTFSGNELIIGVTLALWLAFVALGSRFGSRLKYNNAFGASFVIIALLSQATILFIKFIRPVLGYDIGEAIPLPATIIWTALSIAALCVSIGIQFPLAVSYLREKAADAYSLEAAGAFAGGASFTLLLAGNVDTYILAMLTAMINILVSFCLIKKRALILLLFFPMLFYYGGMNIPQSLQQKGMELVKRAESRYGEITVLKMKEQLNIYSSDKYQFSYPDAQKEEVIAHIPISLHPDAESILIVGGSPAVIMEFMKYPVFQIDFVEIDPAMIEISKGVLSEKDREYLNYKNIGILQTDARRYIKSLNSAKYDLILLNIPEPSTANINRFYTVEFFNEAKRTLQESGMLCLSLPVSYGYIGRKMQTANGSIYASLKSAFPYVEVSSEEYGIFIASQSPIDINPDILMKRFADENIKTAYFGQHILEDAFSPLKINMVKERLGRTKEVNSDIRPVSYLYNLMLWAEVHGGEWLNLILGVGRIKLLIYAAFILFFATLLFIKKRAIVSYTLFTTGYFTMAFSLVLILAFQSYAGYIYETIGLLTGTFMLGGATGAYLSRSIQKPVKWLIVMEASAIILIAVAALFMRSETAFYLYIFAAGLLGGGEFALANLSLKMKGIEKAAGRLYAVDLTGSFIGSLVTSMLMVPLTGTRNTIFFLIFMKAVSLSLLILNKQ
jgi:spermidine synthase